MTIKTDQDPGQEPNDGGQEPKPEPKPEPAKAKEPAAAQAGKTFGEDYVKDIRAKHASDRTKLRTAEKKLADVQKLVDEAKRAEDEEAGRFKEMLATSESKFSRLKKAHLGLLGKQSLIDEGVDPELVGSLVNVDLDGIELDDDFGVVGDLVARAKTVAELVKSKMGKPASDDGDGGNGADKKPATVIDERQRSGEPTGKPERISLKERVKRMGATTMEEARRPRS